MDGAVHETEPARFHGIMLACRTLVKHLILSSCTEMNQDQVENLDLSEVGVQLASSRSGPYRSLLGVAAGLARRERARRGLVAEAQCYELDVVCLDLPPSLFVSLVRPS